MKQPLTSACIMWVYHERGHYSSPMNWGLLVPRTFNVPCRIETAKKLGWENPTDACSFTFINNKYEYPVKVWLEEAAPGWYDHNTHTLEYKYGTANEIEKRTKRFWETFREDNPKHNLSRELCNLALGLTTGL
jgi:hypothetical protein